jgi:hypothetical protein
MEAIIYLVSSFTKHTQKNALMICQNNLHKLSPKCKLLICQYITAKVNDYIVIHGTTHSTKYVAA